MKEKEIWTIDGRKKILLVDENNQIVKEIKDIGPLNKNEKLWITTRPDITYKEWLKDHTKKQKGKKRKRNKKN